METTATVVTAPKKQRGPYKKRKSKASPPKKQEGGQNKPLPPPIETGAAEQIQSKPQSAQSDPSSATSFREPSPGEPLTAEAEQILSGLSDAIPDAGTSGVRITEDYDPLADLAGNDICDEKSAAKLVGIFLAGVRRIRHRECYRLDDDGLAELGGAWNPVLNGLWRKYAPALLLRLNSSVPDLFKAMLATGFALAPMIAEDLADSPVEKQQKQRAPEPRQRAWQQPAGRGASAPKVQPIDDLPPVPPVASGVNFD
ncbi:MAG TPA: hypothetical protein VK574_07625 [Terracidiphilus sp.]|nr:hypothetical protein [Terracidiphilus sp.]